jgi:hypothetical protein
LTVASLAAAIAFSSARGTAAVAKPRSGVMATLSAVRGPKETLRRSSPRLAPFSAPAAPRDLPAELFTMPARVRTTPGSSRTSLMYCVASWRKAAAASASVPGGSASAVRPLRAGFGRGAMSGEVSNRAPASATPAWPSSMAWCTLM